MFLQLKIFKSALMGDLKQWSSRHRRHRRRYCCRYRCSGSNVERKMKAFVSHGKQEMNRILRRGSHRLFAFVGLSSWSSSFSVRYQCRWKNKSDEEAKKKQKKGIDGKVILVAMSGFEIPVGSGNRLVGQVQSHCLGS
jgi:hypothetical protein